MKHIMIFSLIILLLGLSSCEKKDRITTVQGKVIDFGNGEPVEGITVRMTDGIKLSDPIFGEHGDFSGGVAETVTDENGEFTISIEGKNAAAVAPVDPDFSDYWNYDLGETAVSNSFDGYKNGSTNTGEVFIMKAKAFSNLKFISSIESKDSIDFITLDKNGNDNYSYLNYPPAFRNYLTLNEVEIIGNMKFRFRFEFKRDGAWNTIIDSIYVAKGDTINDVIYY